MEKRGPADARRQEKISPPLSENDMPHIEMYCTSVCPYCRSAEMLLARKGFTEIEKIRLDLEPKRWEELETRSEGRRTVPQIFIDGIHVGGFDDLSELNAEGKLDPMLGL